MRSWSTQLLTGLVKIRECIWPWKTLTKTRFKPKKASLMVYRFNRKQPERFLDINLQNQKIQDQRMDIWIYFSTFVVYFLQSLHFHWVKWLFLRYNKFERLFRTLPGNKRPDTCWGKFDQTRIVQYTSSKY